jgi:hypothetical protein
VGESWIKRNVALCKEKCLCHTLVEGALWLTSRGSICTRIWAVREFLSMDNYGIIVRQSCRIPWPRFMSRPPASSQLEESLIPNFKASSQHRFPVHQLVRSIAKFCYSREDTLLSCGDPSRTCAPCSNIIKAIMQHELTVASSSARAEEPFGRGVLQGCPQ